MAQVAVIDDREISITPVFKILELENIPKSEVAGHAVMEQHEVVEVRIGGSRHFSPVFPAAEMSSREGNQVITYAERWAEQYRAFKEGNPQEANGTPLEMLRRFGVTPEQISLCKALKIYSIEGLHHLEGQNAKTLGMHQNKMKAAAASFMAEKVNKGEVFDELAALRAQVAELLAAQAMVVPVQEPTEVEIAQAIASAEGGQTDDDLRDDIEKLTGVRPHHRTSRTNLELLLEQALAAA
jgi:hypothetical protein